MGNTLAHGFALWWFADWPPGSYAQHPSTEPSAFNPWLPRFQKLGEFNLHLDNTPQSEVAVLIDDEGFWHEGLRNDLNRAGVFYQRVFGLPRFGAPHDVYLLNDLIEGKIKSSYKLYIFLNAWHLDDARREKLKQQLRRDGKTAVWVYAAGYLNRDKDNACATLANMRDLTGISFEKSDNPWAMHLHVLDSHHPITECIPQDLFWGSNAGIGPLFHAKDPDARTLGQVVYSMGRCKPGFVLKDFQDWRSIWLASPDIPAPVLRGIARHAGVHLYSDAGDVLHASKHLLSIHTVAGGPRTFKLPQQAEVVFVLYHDRILAENATEFCDDLAPASSALYYAGPEALLTNYWQRH